MKTSEGLKFRSEEAEPLKKDLAELKQAAGGKPIDRRDTRMVCFSPGCGYTEIRVGYFLNKVVECPHCQEISLKGVEIL